MFERFELEHTGAAEQRGDDLKGGILGRRADQGDGAVLNGVQEGVLLGLVEAMNLVDEEDGAGEAVASSGLGGGDDLAQVGDAAGDGRESSESGVGDSRDHPGDRRLAAARRTPKDAGGRGIGFDRSAQRCVGSDQLDLADDLVEIAGPHARRERG